MAGAMAGSLCRLTFGVVNEDAGEEKVIPSDAAEIVHS